MTVTNRELFFQRTKRRYKTVDIPGFGSVTIQSLTESERTQLERRFLNKRGVLDVDKLVDIKICWLIATVVDEHKATMFSDADMEKLRDIDSCITDRIYDEAVAHVGLSAEDQAALLGN